MRWFRGGPGRVGLVLFVLLMCFSAAGAGIARGEDMADSGGKSIRCIALVGASVGRAWDLPGFPERMGERGYEFEYVGRYRFDKSDEIAMLLGREHGKPDAIIIKECAAFFPGDIALYKGLIERWVGQCRAAAVAPVLATVVPVTRTFALRIFILELLHGRWLYPKGTQRAILEYNDWIREYARAEGVALLDLEAAVRAGDVNRYLRESFARRDGMHLNDKAYRALDKIVAPALGRIAFFERKETT